MGQLFAKPEIRLNGNKEFERYIALVEESRSLQRIYVIKEAAKNFLGKTQVSPEKVQLFESLIKIKEKELGR